MAHRVKYEGVTVFYCTDTCRSAAREVKRNLANLRGPCEHCGKPFSSRTSKIFCSQACYMASDRFKAHVLEQQKAATASPRSVAHRAKRKIDRKGIVDKCMDCGDEIYRKPEQVEKGKRKFCSTTCYRSYMAKRFDRWVANPENLFLPQNYDEFLDREELPCLIDGCNWKGKHLSLHVNLAHGVQAEELKRAAGFNLSSGLISRDTAKLLQERENIGVALLSPESRIAARLSQRKPIMRGYRSREAQEHAAKGRAIRQMSPETFPIRTCQGCSKEFRQSTAMGRALYCTTECRDTAYKRERVVHPPKPKIVSCRTCDTKFANVSGKVKHYCTAHCQQEWYRKLKRTKPLSPTARIE